MWLIQIGQLCLSFYPLSNISDRLPSHFISVHRYLQNSIFIFKVQFHNEGGLVQSRHFGVFFGMVYIFILQKISPKRSALQPFLHLLLTQKVKQISLRGFIGWETKVCFCKKKLYPFYSQKVVKNVLEPTF